MRRRRPVTLAIRIAAIVLACIANPLDAGEKDDALSRFQREARQGWAELEKMEEGLEFVVRLTYLHPEAKRLESRIRQYLLTWRRSPGCLRFEIATIKENQIVGRKAVVVNPHYEFVARCMGNEGNGWNFEGFRFRNPNEPDNRHLLEFQAYLYPLTSILNPSGFRMLQMMSEEDCIVDSAVIKREDILVRLSHIAKDGAKVFGKTQAEILFDPSHDWAICSYTLTNKNAYTSRKTEWANVMIGNYRPPAKIITEIHRPATADKPYLTRIAEFESVKPYIASPDEFRLTAFGFPEPPGVEQPKSTWKWPILIGGASTCGLVSLLFAWMGRRNKKGIVTNEQNNGTDV